ncbi:MAG TPA: hypothetical protein VFG86_25010 [Chloroflexota bacterium]|nr:hypothetical protein [Chloroflexota bacterium]
MFGCSPAIRAARQALRELFHPCGQQRRLETLWIGNVERERDVVALPPHRESHDARSLRIQHANKLARQPRAVVTRGGQSEFVQR